MQETTKIQKKKKPFVKKKNVSLFSANFTNFDPVTGEKVADEKEENLRLAKMESLADAKKSRISPNDKEETIKDSATGGSLSYLVSNSAITKDSTRFKGLTAIRKKGLLGIAGAIGAGLLSQRKQKGEFNRQQAAREMFAGKKTAREKEYKSYLNNKYSLEG